MTERYLVSCDELRGLLGGARALLNDLCEADEIDIAHLPMARTLVERALANLAELRDAVDLAV